MFAAEKGTRSAVEEKLRFVAENDQEGATFNADGSEYTDGQKTPVIVTLGSANFPANEVTVARLQKFFDDHRVVFRNENVKAGIFRFGDTVSADINVVLPRKLLEDAKSFAADNNQDSIFVLGTGRSPGKLIKVGGSGDTVLKTRNEFRAAADLLAEGKYSAMSVVKRNAEAMIDQDPNKPLEHRTKRKSFEAVHYSNVKDIKEVDPKYMSPKPGTYQKMYRGAHKSFFFVDGTLPKADENVSGSKAVRYAATIPGDRIYDMVKDPLDLWDDPNPAIADKSLIDAGYAGYHAKTKDGRSFVAMFEPTPVKKMATANFQPGREPEVVDRLPAALRSGPRLPNGFRISREKTSSGTPAMNIVADEVDASLAKNALFVRPERVFEKFDLGLEKLRADPLKFADPRGYAEHMRDVGVWGDLLTAPPLLRTLLEDPKKYVEYLKGGYHGERTKPGTLEAATEGLDSTLEMRKAIGERPAPLITALHHLWGILSRMLPPIEQEAMWLRLVSRPEVLSQIQASIDGTYSLDQTGWAQVVQDARAASESYARGRGNQGTANANAFHAMLAKWNGKWDQVSDAYAAPTSIESGRRFWALGHGSVGIKNKVQRFIGLTFGTPGLIMDRWKFVEFFMPQFGKEPRDYFKYSSFGTPEDPNGLYGTYGGIESANEMLSLAFYEGMETVLDQAIKNSPELQEVLGRHANVGGLHWMGWNAIKNEAVGHSSLDLTFDLAKASPAPTPSDVLALIAKKEYYTEGLVGNSLKRFTLQKGNQ